MAPWYLGLFFAPFALGASNAVQQVQPFVASFTSELQRLLPDKAVVQGPSDFIRIPENVSALLPNNVSNATALGFLSAFGSAAPNNLTSCVIGWLKSAPAKEIAIVIEKAAPPIGTVLFYMGLWNFGFCDEMFMEVCLAVAGLLAGLDEILLLLGVYLYEIIGSLLLCIGDIKPPGQVPLDSLRAVAESKQRISHVLPQLPPAQWASLGKLLQDGHGFEAGFKVGSVFQKAWWKEVVPQPSVVV